MFRCAEPIGPDACSGVRALTREGGEQSPLGGFIRLRLIASVRPYGFVYRRTSTRTTDTDRSFFPMSRTFLNMELSKWPYRKHS